MSRSEIGYDKKVKTNFHLQVIFYISVFVGMLFILNAKRLVFPLFFSYFLILISRPLSRFLKQFKVGPLWNAIIIVILLEFCFFYPIFLMIPVIVEQSNNLELYIPRISEYFTVFYLHWENKVYELLGIHFKMNYLEMGVHYAQDELKVILLNLPNIAAQLLEWIFLIPLFVFFLIKDYQTFLRVSLKLVPNGIYEKIYNLIFKFHHKVGDYIFAKFVEALMIGSLCTFGFYFLNLKFALLFGLIIGITNIVPYLGPFIGAIPPLVFVMVEYGFTSKTVSVVLLLFAANLIDTVVIFPVLVSKIVDLHPFIVIMSVILGSQYLGIAGMIVSIPIASILKLMFDEFQKELYSSID